jgi:hypothetical protein
VDPVIAAEVHPIWNTITSLPFPAAEAVKRRTFNCFACPVTAVNRIAAPVKYTIGRLEPIAVMVARQNNQPLRQGNVLERLKMERGAKTKQRIPADVVTSINVKQTRTK